VEASTSWKPRGLSRPEIKYLNMVAEVECAFAGLILKVYGLD
jgi:hypothetical protein